jgi:hypothetical protein
MHKSLLILLLSLAGAALNAGAGELMNRLNIPLYMDTVFTIAFTLAAGLLPGIICGLFTNIFISSTYLAGWPYYLFAICNIASALITALFVRLFPKELHFSPKDTQPASAKHPFKIVMDRLVVCVLLSFILCIAMSILGGMIAAAITLLAPNPTEGRGPESIMLNFSLFSSQLPVLLREIFSRIPVNIVDRLVSAFTGYGIALALHACIRRFGLNNKQER